MADGVSTQLWKRGEGGELERGWQGGRAHIYKPRSPKILDIFEQNLRYFNRRLRYFLMEILRYF